MAGEKAQYKIDSRNGKLAEYRKRTIGKGNKSLFIHMQGRWFTLHIYKKIVCIKSKKQSRLISLA